MDGPLLESGQSAVEIKICPETMLSLVGFAGLNCGRSAIEERTVRRIV